MEYEIENLIERGTTEMKQKEEPKMVLTFLSRDEHIYTYTHANNGWLSTQWGISGDPHAQPYPYMQRGFHDSKLFVWKGKFTSIGPP